MSRKKAFYWFRPFQYSSPINVENTRKITDVRIHVEQIICSVRQRFQILSATRVLQEFFHTEPKTVVILDSIVRVCCALNNVIEGGKHNVTTC